MVNEYLNLLEIKYGPWEEWKKDFNDKLLLDFDSFKLRDECMKKYAWAIPTELIIKTIAFCSPIIEIGAGTGYWAKLIAERGAEVVAFDDCSSHYTEKDYGTHYKVEWGSDKMIRHYPNHTLFLCWPPMTDMALECAQQYKGDTILYVGEYKACNANDAFFDYMSKNFEVRATMNMPQWGGLHDDFTIYTRKGTLEHERRHGDTQGN